MSKVILHICTSIDGFIADEDGNSDFVFDAQKSDPEFEGFYNSINSVIIGRKTYDYLKDKQPKLFKEKDVFVITHYLRQKEKNVTFVHENIMGCVKALKKDSKKNIWVLGGSEIVNILLKEKLIDEVVITTAPLVLGTGIRLFKEDNPCIKAKLKSTQTFDDFTQATYKI
ncbi:MAG: dihydrofolate reductase [Alphaproteobacteria bacterium]|nr:dihydrofolate reductase [Alphaproteobacteria bacterium]